MSFDEAFLHRLAGAIRSARLDAIVVGNAGSILRGAPVLTHDVDLLMRDTTQNRAKLEAVARAIGGSRPEPLSELSRGLCIHADVPVDVLLDALGGVRFESIRARSSAVSVGGGRTLRVAALRDIIRAKEKAGRPKDLACLPILRDTLRVTEGIDAASATTRSTRHRKGKLY